MDYSNNGGHGQPGSNEVFFTPGNGELPPDVNGSGKSLNKTNIASKMEKIAPKNNCGKIGNAAIENTPDQEKINEEVVLSSSGPLVDEVPADSVAGQSDSETPEIYQGIKTNKSTITSQTEKAIDHATKKFRANGEAANFYKIAREMAVRNLANSFNRTIGGKV